ncbi:MAG: hypothetical protein FWG70_03485 [Oscillospiraceae bacterium]|nr:hypothetical protein [Oscillospiraceae bacterium]
MSTEVLKITKPTYMKKHAQMVAVYSFTHFLVDFACAFFMFRIIAGTPNGYLCVLIYNFCAFAMQMPIGIIADRLNRNFLFAMLGCVLVGSAYGLAMLPLAAVTVIGIGNAMFHIGGGIDVLNISQERLSMLGVFVSPGAFGIYYGAMLGADGGFLGFGNLGLLIIPLSLIIAALFILVVYKTRGETYIENAEFSLKTPSFHGVSVMIFCLFLVVCLRSFTGLALDFPWKGTGHTGTFLICAVVFGKVLGGFAADRFGVRKTAFCSLFVAAILFLFPSVSAAGIMAVLLFNFTMPITLWAVARLVPGAKGFAFGLLTFGLFIGFLPVYLGLKIPLQMFWLYALICAVTLVLLIAGLKRVK